MCQKDHNCRILFLTVILKSYLRYDYWKNNNNWPI